MKTKTNIKLLLTGLILAIFMGGLSAQTNFEDVTGEPVLSWGDNVGDWDWGAVWFPAVIKDGDTLRMWFTGCEDQIWVANSWKIGYAWSLDGIEWNKDEGNPVLSPDLPWEGDYHGCAVIKDVDTLKMWYGTSGPTDVIGYATSDDDGITWTKYPSPVLQIGPELDWDDTSISAFTVIKEVDEYKMWYHGNRPGFPQIESLPQIGLATSPDGKEWTKYDDPTTTEPPFASSDPVFKVGETGEWDSHRSMDPMVLKKGSGYEMWYAGLVGPINTSVLQQIGYATSDDDGIDWVRHPDNPVYTDPTPWGKAIYGGSVLKFGGYYHLWYACFSTFTSLAYPQIGYAKSLVCPPGDIIFSTQQQIDDFQTNYPACTEINGSVSISGDDITNLDGLSSLTSIMGDLSVISNPLLTSLSGLDSINEATITELTITNNSELYDCDVWSICQYLIAPGGTVVIENNKTECNSIEEVQEHCLTEIEEYGSKEELSISPNPCSGSVKLRLVIGEQGLVFCDLFEVSGIKVKSILNERQFPGTYEMEIDLSELMPGIYFCVLKTSEGIQTKKMIKL